MSKSVEFEKVRAKRQRMHRLKQVVYLVVAVVMVLAGIFLNDFLVKRSITSQIGELFDSVGGKGYPIRSPGGLIRGMSSVGKNLVVLNDSSLYVFNSKGKQLSNIQQMSERSVYVTNSDRVVVYNEGNPKLSVYSPTSKVFSEEMTGKIRTLALGKNGEVAVVASAQQHLADIIVYSKDMQRMWTRSVSENQVATLAISTKGTTIAVGYLTSNGGVIESIVTIYSMADGKELATITLTDHLVLRLEYQIDGKLKILTDKQYSLYSVDGQSLGAYSIPAGNEIEGFETNGSESLLYYKNTRSLQREYVFLDSGCQLVGIMPINEERVLDVAITGKFIYVLMDNVINKYNFSLEPKEEIGALEVQRIEPVNNEIFMLTKSEIKKLGDEE